MISWIKETYQIVKTLFGKEYEKLRIKAAVKDLEDNLTSVLDQACSPLIDREVSRAIGKKYSTSIGPCIYGVGIKLKRSRRMEKNDVVYYADTFYISLKDLYAKGFKVRAFGADDSSLEKTRLLQKQQEIATKFI